MTLSALMFGRNGQVAREVRSRAGPNFTVTALGREDADLADPDACARCIARCEADIVINAAAYTAVDRAEVEQDLAMTVNATAAAAMARAAAARGLPFIHLSTDYVFDGAGATLRRESDPTGPINVYGRTKLAGEQGVAAAGGRYAILRTAWVYAGHGANFVSTMLRLGRERDALQVVDDQHGGPTPAAAIALAVETVGRGLAAGHGETGVFHFAGSPTVSWRAFAEAIFAAAVEAGALERAPVVTPISTDAWPTAAARPRFSGLDCSRIRDCYGLAQPEWRDGLRAHITALATSRADTQDCN